MLPASQSDISTTNSFSRRIACDKLGLSVKGAGKITLVILTEGCACIAIHISRRNPSVYSLMLVATSPFRGDIVVFRDFNFGYYYELLYAP